METQSLKHTACRHPTDRRFLVILSDSKPTLHASECENACPNPASHSREFSYPGARLPEADDLQDAQPTQNPVRGWRCTLPDSQAHPEKNQGENQAKVKPVRAKNRDKSPNLGCKCSWMFRLRLGDLFLSFFLIKITPESSPAPS
jgi:hypothetical protein